MTERLSQLPLAFLKHTQACSCPTGKLLIVILPAILKVLLDGRLNFCLAARHRQQIQKYTSIQLSRCRYAPFDSSASPLGTTAARRHSMHGALVILLDTRARRWKRENKNKRNEQRIVLVIATNDVQYVDKPPPVRKREGHYG